MRVALASVAAAALIAAQVPATYASDVRTPLASYLIGSSLNLRLD